MYPVALHFNCTSLTWSQDYSASTWARGNLRITGKEITTKSHRRLVHRCL